MIECVKQFRANEYCCMTTLARLRGSERDRDDDIFYNALQGFSIDSIAQKFCLSRARVNQIVHSKCQEYNKLYIGMQDSDSLHNLNLSNRSYRALVRSGITSISALETAVRDSFVKGKAFSIRGAGELSRNEILGNYYKYTGKHLLYQEPSQAKECVGRDFKIVVYDNVSKTYKTKSGWGSLEEAYKYTSLENANSALKELTSKYKGSKHLELRRCKTVLVNV